MIHLDDQAATTLELEGRRAELVEGGDEAHEPEPILRWFAFMHLPPHLSGISAAFCALAVRSVENLPSCPERTVALRKLLESKDAAERAALEDS